MIYITQLIYVKEGQEAIFHQFEDLVIPLIADYNGDLMLRLRPGADAVVAQSIDMPYEIHLVSFPTEQDFDNYMRDDRRKQFLHLKEQSIKAAIFIKGAQL